VRNIKKKFSAKLMLGSGTVDAAGRWEESAGRAELLQPQVCPAKRRPGSIAPNEQASSPNVACDSNKFRSATNGTILRSSTFSFRAQ